MRAFSSISYSLLLASLFVFWTELNLLWLTEYGAGGGGGGEGVSSLRRRGSGGEEPDGEDAVVFGPVDETLEGL